MNTAYVENDLLELLTDALGRKLDRLPDPDEPLMTALGMDSLEALHLLVAVEQRFDVYFPDHSLSQLNTLRRLTESIQEQLMEESS